MRRLHLKFYLAIVGTLMIFLLAGAMVWHHFSSPQAAMSGIESATSLAAALLDDASSPERRSEVIEALARRLRADIAVYDAKGTVRQVSGGEFPLTAAQVAERGWQITQSGPTYNYLLENGDHILVHPRHRFFWHSIHMGFLLVSIAVILALLTYPIARGITARLARLEAGVQQFGAGNLAARVKVEGRDEVASLATSFNESAGHVERLVHAHQLLLANCSHELRTPLARIRLAVERVPGTDPAVTAELARNIAELDTLIGEMLLSSRLDVSGGTGRTERVDLLALVAEEAAHFDLEVSGDAVTMEVDSLLLRRLVRNLLENARLHGGGATDVRIEKDERHARILVEDAGGGVLAEDREKIFDPFFRSQKESAPSAQSGGAGLGLSIVRQIARAHGGTVAYTPRDGAGSRFTVTLPR